VWVTEETKSPNETTLTGNDEMIEYQLPEIHEDMEDSEIEEWLVKEGDEVLENQPLLIVLTNTSSVEIPSPADGVIAQLMLAEGDSVEPGDVILHLEEDE
jgi:pyruvate/2-oxoglutarate dehydrogenase complex dihydrolipoamide acyltransferase (E2) component